MLHDGQRERPLADREVDLAVRDRQRERRAAIDRGRDLGDGPAIERADRDVARAMDLLAGQLREQLPRVAVGVHDDASGVFAAAVQARGVGHPHLDPRRDPAGEIAHEQRRFVAR